MSNHRLLTAAAARLTGAVSAPAIVAGGAPAAPAAGVEEGTVDVVALADAQAAVADAEIRGATAERERTAAVFASDGGKANPAMAAWMLEHNASASAAAIVAQLGSMPAPAAVVAPAAPVEPAAPATPAAAITVPLTATPKIDVGAENNLGADEGKSQADIDKSWDASISAAAVSASGSAGAELAPGIPRTGN